MLVDATGETSPIGATEGALYDELLCLADTKLVLAGWYMVVLPNGRGIPDWSALCGMLQDHYGHARALYQYLGRYGLTREEAEWARGPGEIRSARLLDRPPRSWTDFVVTMLCAEHLLSTLLGGYRDNEQDRALAGLARKMEREARFHLSYATGWLRALAGDDPSVITPFRDRLALALDWWGPDETDCLFEAGLRTAPERALSDTFVAALDAELPDANLGDSVGSDARPGWRREFRRSGPRGIPESLYELIRFKYVELAVP
jgi:1,2-phenylacetyl-CoA epoxidase catalytic subunit